MNTMLSIHDVMPRHLTAVSKLIEKTLALGWPPATLLVVPHVSWSADQIQQLKTWAAQGHPLAGHGWTHQIERFGGWRHRIHSALFSRDVAEHLALDAEGILDLMRRCHGWFSDQGLPAPDLYVPPAWALGDIPTRRLTEQPFKTVETLSGILTIQTGQRHYRALLGYEADQFVRALALRISNSVNRCRAGSQGLRIGLHPPDADLLLADDLWQDLKRFSPRLPEDG